MKKVLLSGAALLAMATSAHAEGLKLDLAGYAKAYGVYNNNDETGASSLREFNLRKDTEIHFTGETTLDSGLTVGAHMEADVDDDDNFSTDEAYIYMSGGWGRVNVGEEDGAAYLLQVSAPSADSNIDGLRQYISTYDNTGNGGGTTRLDYDMVAPAGSSAVNKLTYMTPVFNGFQAGVSYIPSITDGGVNGFVATAADNNANQYDDAYELAARYEGAFEGVGLAIGAGYGIYNAENTAASTVSDDATLWNAGIDLNFAGFGLGFAYLDQTTENATVETDLTTMVVGADYQMGAYKLGVSWLNQETDPANAADTEIDRYTVGASYSYGPGMSFRGSVSMIDNDNNIDATQVSLGTQVNF